MRIKRKNIFILVLVGVIAFQFVLFIVQGSKINKLSKDIELLKNPAQEKAASYNGEGSTVVSSSSSKNIDSESGTTEGIFDESLPKGVFLYRENAVNIILETVQTSKYKDYNYSNNLYYIITENSYIIFVIPDSAIVDDFSETRFKFHVSNDWISVSYLYEFEDSIQSRYDTERKVNGITSQLKNAYHDEKYDARYYLKDYQEFYYTLIGDNSAAYSFLSVKEMDSNSYELSELYEESFAYIDNIPLHEKIQIDYYNYKDYYDSCDTEMRKKEVADERDSVFNYKWIKCCAQYPKKHERSDIHYFVDVFLSTTSWMEWFLTENAVLE